LISKVQGIAHKAGIRKWDILMAIGEEKISSIKQAHRILMRLTPDDSITMTLFSKGKLRTVTLTAK